MPLGDNVTHDIFALLLSKYSILSRCYLDNKRKRSYNTHAWKRLLSSCCHSTDAVGNVPFTPEAACMAFPFFSPPGSILITLFRGPSTTKPKVKWIHLENPKKLWSQPPAGVSLGSCGWDTEGGGESGGGVFLNSAGQEQNICHFHCWIIPCFLLLVIIPKCSGAGVSSKPTRKEAPILHPWQPPALSLSPSFCSPRILSTDQRNRVGVKVMEEGLQPFPMLAGKELPCLC